MDHDGDAVIGLVERGQLSSVLTTIHRSGQGHNARVLDAARGDVTGQLRRAGVTADLDAEVRTPDSVVLLIHAPGRTAKTAEMLQRAGASSVRVVWRAGAEVPQPHFAPPAPKGRAQPAPTTDLTTD
ncbi:MAG TPA: hypothetical protein VKB09_16715 [Thermomicrobiales bacterium]|nr:hypothetical protein [Thermomicrobiales bacterium]